MPLKVALIGQAPFGAAVLKALKEAGHEIVGAFTIPDKKREDAVAVQAKELNVPVFKYKRWRTKGVVIPEILEEFKATGADVAVMAFVSQFIPLEICNTPRFGAICYHPSMLPLHRGASAINWTIMSGRAEAGFSIFYPDEGLDTGEILLQRSTPLLADDTVNSVYTRFLFPEGVRGLVDAVNQLEDGSAPRIKQSEEGACYDEMWNDAEKAQIDFSKDAQTVHNFVRGSDSVPGAWTMVNGERVTFFGSTRTDVSMPADGVAVTIDGAPDSVRAVVSAAGVTVACGDGQFVRFVKARRGTKNLAASALLDVADDAANEIDMSSLTTEEKAQEEVARGVWLTVLGVESLTDETDFFASGAGSMDTTRVVEALQAKCDVTISTDDFLNATQYGQFRALFIKQLRSKGDAAAALNFSSVSVDAPNGRTVSFPTQLFINGRFVDSSDGKTRPTIDPSTEESLADIAQATSADVDTAVAAAQTAFASNAPWRRMSARDRGKLLMRLADLMDRDREELATIESLDSGAVYTLAVKTHIGMSIDTLRYFAGLCDKISGRTIPINASRPSANICFTRINPVGVCGLVVPWNYPFMMCMWKLSPCLAAGNVAVIKPANVTPLTALKLAALSLEAGFPPGVINVLTGSGTSVGNAIASHPHIRKIGFTGSTGVGKQIMAAAAQSNLKKCSLELGGKSPLIIFADCDIERAVRQTLGSAFFNKGENCIAAGRVFVEESMHDAFIERLITETKKMKIGDVFDTDTSHGPQNHEAHLNKLLGFVERGVKEGAKLVCGGKRVDRKGYFFEPTIFTDVTDSMWIAEEESFGPILIILKFDGDVEKVIERANASEFGLASGVFTRDINKALRVSEALEAGTVFVNTYNKTDVAAPFGGVKQSGFGKDLGQEAIHEWTTTKVVTIEYQ